jgi:hypothetical protein
MYAPFGVGVGTVVCPYCRAKAGEWCQNMRKSGFVLPRPHPERTAAYRVEQKK